MLMFVYSTLDIAYLRNNTLTVRWFIEPFIDDWLFNLKTCGSYEIGRIFDR